MDLPLTSPFYYLEVKNGTAVVLKSLVYSSTSTVNHPKPLRPKDVRLDVQRLGWGPKHQFSPYPLGYENIFLHTN